MFNFRLCLFFDFGFFFYNSFSGGDGSGCDSEKVIKFELGFVTGTTGVWVVVVVGVFWKTMFSSKSVTFTVEEDVGVVV